MAALTPSPWARRSPPGPSLRSWSSRLISACNSSKIAGRSAATRLDLVARSSPCPCRGRRSTAAPGWDSGVVASGPPGRRPGAGRSARCRQPRAGRRRAGPVPGRPPAGGRTPAPRSRGQVRRPTGAAAVWYLAWHMALVTPSVRAATRGDTYTGRGRTAGGGVAGGRHRPHEQGPGHGRPGGTVGHEPGGQGGPERQARRASRRRSRAGPRSRWRWTVRCPPELGGRLLLVPPSRQHRTRAARRASGSRPSPRPGRPQPRPRVWRPGSGPPARGARFLPRRRWSGLGPAPQGGPQGDPVSQAPSHARLCIAWPRRTSTRRRPGRRPRVAGQVRSRRHTRRTNEAAPSRMVRKAGRSGRPGPARQLAVGAIGEGLGRPWPGSGARETCPGSGAGHRGVLDRQVHLRASAGGNPKRT